MNYYCPKCGNVLEKVEGCGSVSYLCDHCKELVSRSKVVSEEEHAAKAKAKEQEQK
ncbi:zinc-ribbon domain-containing protein [Anaerotalea alkaliphila]|uniref:Uncharacterized protein n=1 Tax=Anaerotalea alkaliphila TaxID=2662126 RepID=A0A7X5HX19_9FIRM|nr:zinc-ribbon domain-containing protein [Anaerotalea alkaliphila]NDL68196.1 hypothetical protein [Anaerotalea alkaliphila]